MYANDNTQHFLRLYMSELRHQQIEPSSLEFLGKVNVRTPFPFPPYYSFHTCSARRGGEAALVQLGGDCCFAPQSLFGLCSLSPSPRLIGAFPYPLPCCGRHLSDSAPLVWLSRCP